MIGNYYILLYSLCFIFLVLLYLNQRVREIDVIDIYIIFVLFQFGFFPFVRGLHFGRDLIYDFTQGDPLSLGLVFAQVLVILVILRLISFIIIKDMTYLKVTYLVENYAKINKYALSLMYIIVIGFLMFSYYKYGIKSYIQPDDFKKIGKVLPYWFTSFRTIYVGFSFCLCLVLLSYIFKAPNFKSRIFWLILTIVFIPFAAMYGKRYFANIIIMGTVFYVGTRNDNFFKLRNIKYGIILVAVLFLGFNIFNSYRGFIDHMGEVTSEEVRNLRSPLVAVTNFTSTLESLATRPGTWEFSYLVLNKQIRDGVSTTKGQIIKEGFKSAIPRKFWPEKNFVLIDDFLGKLYGVKPKEIDIGKNFLGIAQLEFGFLSIIIVPGIILSIILLLSFLNKHTNNYPIFLWLYSGNILYHLINIEENGTDIIFMMLRYTLLISLIFGICILGEKIFSVVNRKIYQ